MASLFQKEPTLVLGSLVTVAVSVYAKWRGLSVEEVLAQAGGLLAAFAVIRSRVTPYIERVQEFRKGLHRDGDLDPRA
jgi:hypothetical protein